MHSSKLLEGLNQAQRQAVLHGEGPALVAAGPGSGKTFTITRRLLYLIQEQKVPPQDILVITFTKEAAKTMQERFFSQLQEFGMSRTTWKGFVSFGTFHSYFYQIIKSIKKYSEYQLITQQEKQRIAKCVLKENTDDTEEVSDSAANHFLTQVSFYKNTGIVKNNMLNRTKVQKLFSAETEKHRVTDAEGTRFLQQFERYEALKHAYKRMDFDDMLYLCYKEFLESRELLEYCQKRFSYILVDEFQDCNFVQYQLLRMLILPPYNLFVVGDDDQAIYGFRGSDTEIFQRFLKDFPQTEKVYLLDNYRCDEKIVKVSKRLIEKNKLRVDKELVSAVKKGSMGQIQVIGAIHVKESYEKVAGVLQGREDLEKEAVLFRTNASMQMFASFLSGRNVPFVMKERCQSIYEHFLVKDIMDYFQAASGMCDRGLLLRIFQKMRVPIGREALRTEQVDLKQVKAFYAGGFYENQRIVEEIGALERHLERLGKMRPKLGIHYILHAMDYEGYLIRKAGENREFLEEWYQLIDWLMEDAAEYIDFKGWQKKQQIYTEELEKRQNILQKDKKGVHLLTLHASKGLEFKKVYIMNLNEGIIPQYKRGETLSEERLEEERRLLYVGMTRAKESLEFYYLTGTKEKPKLRSRFLEEVGLESSAEMECSKIKKCSEFSID